MSEFIGKSISCRGVPVEDRKAGGCRSSGTSCSTAVLLGEVTMVCSGTDLTLAGFAWPKLNFCISDSALCGVEAGACLRAVTPLVLCAFLRTSLQFPQFLVYQTQTGGSIRAVNARAQPHASVSCSWLRSSQRGCMGTGRVCRAGPARFPPHDAPHLGLGGVAAGAMRV